MRKKLLYIICVLSIYSCKNENIIFKENFEAGIVGKTPEKPWKTSGKGIIRIDTLNVFEGKQAIYFESGEGFANRAFITIENQLPKDLIYYYGSMKMYVEKASPDGVHWTMIQTSGKTSKGFEAEIRYGGQHNKRIMANYDTPDLKTDCWHHTSFKIPEKKWFSIQWYMNRDVGNMKLWINQKLVHELNANTIEKGCLGNENNNEWTFPMFEKITLGWVDYQRGGSTRKVWIDDVVLSKEKVN
ncbi:hypothetical protein [Tenacibaculum amylolyticum]|uniref:hypothetical protein n=1 Tax=Tenacibaculum amylolyticum TaxID=104269 RepID=UPI003895FC82